MLIDVTLTFYFSKKFQYRIGISQRLSLGLHPRAQYKLCWTNLRGHNLDLAWTSDTLAFELTSNSLNIELRPSRSVFSTFFKSRNLSKMSNHLAEPKRSMQYY